MRLFITGVSGFVGQALERRLHQAGYAVSGSARHEHRMAGGTLAGVAQLHTVQDWSGLLRGCSAVVRLAARVHIMHDTAPDPLAAFRHDDVPNPEDAYALSKHKAEQGLRALAAARYHIA